MAGEWIKMRTNLWDDPRVGRICDMTGLLEAQVIGGLYWLWKSADEHTETGHMPGLSTRRIDQKTGCPGLGKALVVIGWVTETDDGVTLENFEEHNGSSAKKRCQTAKRVANFKAGNAEVTHQALPNEDECVSTALPREEKIREDKSREENIELRETKIGSASRKRSALVPSRPDDVGEQTWSDWLGLRKAKKSPVTETVLKAMRSESEQAGKTLDEVLAICCQRGWQGFKAEWIAAGHLHRGLATIRPPSRHSGFQQLDYTTGVNDDGSFN